MQTIIHLQNWHNLLLHGQCTFKKKSTNVKSAFEENLNKKKNKKNYYISEKDWNKPIKAELFPFFCYENFMFQKMSNHNNLFAVAKQSVGSNIDGIAKYCL